MCSSDLEGETFLVDGFEVCAERIQGRRIVSVVFRPAAPASDTAPAE